MLPFTDDQIDFINNLRRLENKKGIVQIFLELFFDAFITIAPSANYVFQIRKFSKTKSSKGFSLLLCFITLFSHSLRIFFWFGKKFKLTLLIQSILVITMQLILTHLCVKYDDTKNSYPIENSFIIRLVKCKNTFNFKKFWNWNDEIEYFKFYIILMTTILMLSFCFGFDNTVYMEIIGTAGVFFDIMTGLPQIIEFYRVKNSKNISTTMVLLWVFGNILKIIYNVIYKSPIQLILGCVIQLCFNIIMTFQIYYYAKCVKQDILTNDFKNADTLEMGPKPISIDEEINLK